MVEQDGQAFRVQRLEMVAALPYEAEWVRVDRYALGKIAPSARR